MLLFHAPTIRQALRIVGLSFLPLYVFANNAKSLNLVFASLPHFSHYKGRIMQAHIKIPTKNYKLPSFL